MGRVLQLISRSCMMLFRVFVFVLLDCEEGVKLTLTLRYTGGSLIIDEPRTPHLVGQKL